MSGIRDLIGFMVLISIKYNYRDNIDVIERRFGLLGEVVD